MRRLCAHRLSFCPQRQVKRYGFGADHRLIKKRQQLAVVIGKWIRQPDFESISRLQLLIKRSHFSPPYSDILSSGFLFNKSFSSSINTLMSLNWRYTEAKRT